MLKLTKTLRLIHTIKHLKMIQIYYRFFYLLRNKIRKITNHQYSLSIETLDSPRDIKFMNFIHYNTIYENQTFTFLNIKQSFESEVFEWNYSKYGKLWTYNLNYFDYLRQENMSCEKGESLIEDFVDKSPTIKDGLMPFPISLRGINWVIFLSTYQIKNQKINSSLYAQYMKLMDNLEYHILGNHLLENSFSLLFGAYYFNDEILYAKAYTILTNELDEQILSDGAHFELSPMYHQIMLLRVLDCINLMQNNDWKDDNLVSIFILKAEKMLGWLECMTYENGNIPLFNDSTTGIAPTSKELFKYALKLGIKVKHSELDDSGYRKITNRRYECVIDVGNIGPDYIPGHAHSDTFNFELYVKNKPVIVDTGLSTYEANKLRAKERSTSSHNTVEINGMNQSQVWGGFRVAQRAKVIELVEDENSIFATHDGYKKLGYMHTRKWKFTENSITVIDTIVGKEANAISYLHFHPNVSVKIENNIVLTPFVTIEYPSTVKLSLSEYNYASKFNQTIKAIVVMATFKNNLTMEITTL